MVLTLEHEVSHAVPTQKVRLCSLPLSSHSPFPSLSILPLSFSPSLMKCMQIKMYQQRHQRVLTT